MDRRQLKRLQRALLLGVSDMDLAAVAAQAITAARPTLARALETAMAVSYMRPFSTSNLAVPRSYVPTDPDSKALHETLRHLRNTTYAHTDGSNERLVTALTVEPRGALRPSMAVYIEEWTPFPREQLPRVIDLCRRLAEEMATEAERLQHTINMQDIETGRNVGLSLEDHLAGELLRIDPVVRRPPPIGPER